MLREFQNKVLGLALVIVLLIAGGIVSMGGTWDNSAAHETSITPWASTDSESCQSTSNIDTNCSKDNSHSDPASSNSHCQQHCGHSQTGMLSAVNLTAPDPRHKKAEQNSQSIPESIAFDPGSRPPNL